MEQINITFLDACENHSCVFVRSGFFSFCAKLIASNPDPLEKKIALNLIFFMQFKSSFEFFDP